MHEKCKENHPRQRIFRAINKSTQQFTTPKLTHNLFVVERLSWTAVAFLEKKIAIIFIILYKAKVMLPIGMVSLVFQNSILFRGIPEKSKEY
jgi:hypothetical protein